jgi:tetratricopeptide (TPR) repeat protein
MKWQRAFLNTRAFYAVSASLSLLFLSVPFVHAARAQESETAGQFRKDAIELYKQNRFEEALPLLEQLTLTHPKDAALQEALGACLLSHAVGLPDPEARRQTRLRARQAFLRAKDLGDNSNYLQTALDSIPEDGSGDSYSAEKDVDAAMRAAETAFGRGDFAGALAGYAGVLKLDPKNYQAALFSGDVCFKQKDYDNSYKWFKQAVAIDPDQETAYRYWGDALYAAGNNREARDKFIDAVVASPYQRNAWVGLTQWAQRNGLTIAQPKIGSPNSMTGTNGGDTTITINAATLGKKDGTESWLLYEITRFSWKKGEFQKQFPSEKEYRHSLAEESQALGLVADTVSEQLASKKIKARNLDPQLETLTKLRQEGLLDAYILLARSDQGIAQDYVHYRKDHRDKLVQYMNEYAVPQVK